MISHATKWVFWAPGDIKSKEWARTLEGWFLTIIHFHFCMHSLAHILIHNITNQCLYSSPRCTVAQCCHGTCHQTLASLTFRGLLCTRSASTTSRPHSRVFGCLLSKFVGTCILPQVSIHSLQQVPYQICHIYSLHLPRVLCRIHIFSCSAPLSVFGFLINILTSILSAAWCPPQPVPLLSTCT